MTVYVDELRDYYALRGEGFPGMWCHMVTDGSLEELHAMARRMGLSPRRFQDHPHHPHYDLMATGRALALTLGAREATTRELRKLFTHRSPVGTHRSPPPRNDPMEPRFPSPRPLSLAARTGPFQESVIREMTRLGDETGAVNLSQGLPEFDSPAEVLEAAVEAIRRGENQYTFPFGTPELRAAVALKTRAYNHIPTDPETEVTVTCGVSEAVMSAILALTDPGDEVVILEPWYENYVPGCRMAGATPRFVPMRGPELTFDPAELRAAFNARTRLVILNTPQNPTGRVLTRAELSVVAALCQEFGVIAVTDEIYEHILYDGREHVSIGSLPGMEDRAVTISGLGKTYALTGWRVGWTVAHPRLTALIRKVHDYMTICAPAPFQAGGVAALNLPEGFYTDLRRQYDERRRFLLAALDRAGLPYRTPEGAYYVMAYFDGVDWPRARYTRPGWSEARAFAEFMARDVGVAVVPGSSFYFERPGGAGPEAQRWVRINFAKRPETLQAAASRLMRLTAQGA